jgi:hypothetical protein
MYQDNGASKVIGVCIPDPDRKHVQAIREALKRGEKLFLRRKLLTDKKTGRRDALSQ